MLLIAPEIVKYATFCFQIQLRTQTIQCLFFTRLLNFLWGSGRVQLCLIPDLLSILNLD